MSDTPRRPKPAADPGYEVIDAPDPGYEVIDPPPAAKKPVLKARPVARAVAPPPEPDSFDEEDDTPPPRKRSDPNRRAVFLYRSYAGLLAFLAVVAGGLYLIGGGKPVVNWDPDPVPALARPVTVPKVPAGWHEYHDHLAAFDLLAPDAATAESVDMSKARLPAGMAPPRGVKWDHAGKTFLITVGGAPPNSLPPAERDGDVGNNTLASFLAGLKSTLPLRPAFGRAFEQPKYQLVGGHRGVVASETLQDGRAMHIQATIHAGVSYTLVVTAPAGATADDPEVAPFFDGFKLTPGASPPAGATAPPTAAPPADPPPPTGRPTLPPSRLRKR